MLYVEEVSSVVNMGVYFIVLKLRKDIKPKLVNEVLSCLAVKNNVWLLHVLF